MLAPVNPSDAGPGANQAEIKATFVVSVTQYAYLYLTIRYDIYKYIYINMNVKYEVTIPSNKNKNKRKQPTKPTNPKDMIYNHAHTS